MTQEQWNLLRDIIMLVIFLAPVIAVFWKMVKYVAKVENDMGQNKNAVTELKEYVDKVVKKVEEINDRNISSNNTILVHTETLSEHAIRIEKLEARTNKMCDDLADIKAENSKQTAMLEMLINKDIKK